MPGSTNYPGALDTFPEIGPNTSEDGAGVEHDVVHANEMAAIAALQTKVGINGSANSTSIDARLSAVESGKLDADLLEFDASGKIVAAYLPSYVDDVLEFANTGAFPATGETGKIYIALATNAQYRWSGSAYVVITASPGTTDDVPEGTTNLYHTAARAAAAAPIQSIGAGANVSIDNTDPENPVISATGGSGGGGGEGVSALSIVAGVVNINLALGSFFTLALTANVTGITFTNLPAAGTARSIYVRIRQDATGGRTVALPASFKIKGGSDLTVVSTANAYTLLEAMTFDQGERWEYAMQDLAASVVTNAFYTAVFASTPNWFCQHAETSGTTAINEMGDDGTYVGTPVFGATPIYTDGLPCWDLNGASHVDIPANILPSGSTAISLGILLKRKNNSGIQALIDRDPEYSSRYWQWRLNGTTEEFVKITPGVQVASLNNAADTNAIVLLIVTMDTTGQTKFYTNGTQTLDNDLTAADLGSNTIGLRVGRRIQGDSQGNYYCAASIVWPRNISAAEALLFAQEAGLA